MLAASCSCHTFCKCMQNMHCYHVPLVPGTHWLGLARQHREHTLCSIMSCHQLALPLLGLQTMALGQSVVGKCSESGRGESSTWLRGMQRMRHHNQGDLGCWMNLCHTSGACCCICVSTALASQTPSMVVGCFVYMYGVQLILQTPDTPERGLKPKASPCIYRALFVCGQRQHGRQAGQ